MATPACQLQEHILHTKSKGKIYNSTDSYVPRLLQTFTIVKKGDGVLTFDCLRNSPHA